MLIDEYFMSLSKETLKYSIYILSLPFDSHDYQNSPDFGSGDFQYISSLAFCSTAHAHDLLLVLVLEVELKLSIKPVFHLANLFARTEKKAT